MARCGLCALAALELSHHSTTKPSTVANRTNSRHQHRTLASIPLPNLLSHHIPPHFPLMLSHISGGEPPDTPHGSSVYRVQQVLCLTFDVYQTTPFSSVIPPTVARSDAGQSWSVDARYELLTCGASSRDGTVTTSDTASCMTSCQLRDRERETDRARCREMQEANYTCCGLWTPTTAMEDEKEGLSVIGSLEAPLCVHSRGRHLADTCGAQHRTTHSWTTRRWTPQ